MKHGAAVPASFGEFQLTMPSGPLSRYGREVALRRKSLAVLCSLCRRAGETVTKQDLLSEVWEDRVVCEGSLAVCIHEIRKTIEENPQKPALVRTVHHMGYRFEIPSQISAAPGGEFFVGRRDALSTLRDKFETAMAGRRQLVVIKGFSGMGKTALIDAFRDRIEPDTEIEILAGQCTSQGRSGDAYLPYLDGIRTALSSNAAAAIVDPLRRYAPSWLAQFRSLLDEASTGNQPRIGAGTEAYQIQREYLNFIEALSRDRPVLLVLEDMHWSDQSSIELLELLARATVPSRLLILVTCRQGEGADSLATLLGELTVHRSCTEITLRALTAADVSRHLSARLDVSSGDRLGGLIYDRTEGHPLFMSLLADHILGPADAAMDAQELPPDLAAFVDLRVGQLDELSRRILEAASVSGMTSSVGALASALNMDVEDVEEACENLFRQSEFVEVRSHSGRHGSSRGHMLGFRHVLFSEIIYNRLGKANRRRMHRAVGEYMERTYSDFSGAISPTLAYHFELAGDVAKAIRFLEISARHNSRLHAYSEAEKMLRRALALVQGMVVSDDHASVETRLLLALGPVLIARYGYGSSEVSEVFCRARDLCRAETSDRYMASIRRGLAGYFILRADFHTAYELGSQILRGLPHEIEPDDGAIVEGALVCGIAGFFRGKFRSAVEATDQSLTSYDHHEHARHAEIYGIDPRAIALSFNALSVWMLDREEAAFSKSKAALEHAEGLGHPFTLSQCLSAAAFLAQMRDDFGAMEAYSRSAIEIATEHGFEYIEASEHIRIGLKEVVDGHIAKGIVRIETNVSRCAEIGALAGRTSNLAVLARAQLAAGRPVDALTTIGRALDHAERRDETYFEPFLHALEGVALLRMGCELAPLAEQKFQEAMALADRQQARRCTRTIETWSQIGLSV